jgi:hypothetical protein
MEQDRQAAIRDSTWHPTRGPAFTQPAKRSPTPTELAWSAGFFEGEASFKTTGIHTPGILVSQVNREPLDRLLAIFGGQIRFQRKQKPGWSDQYNWYVHAARAVGIAMTIYQFMSAKRKTQIEKMLRAWKEAA